MQNYLGQEIPVTNYSMGGGMRRALTPQEAELQRQQNSMDFMNNAVGNLGAGNASLYPETSVAAPPASSGGSFLEKMMAFLGGGGIGGAKQRRVGSGDTTIEENQGDTLGSWTSFINNLMNTAMGGKTAADKNATELGLGLLGANTQGELANLGSKERASRMDWVGNTFGNLRPGFNPAAVPQANKVDAANFTKGIPTDQIYGGGLGGADPLGLLGIPAKAPPPPEESGDVSRSLMAGGGVKRFRPTDYLGVE